MKNHHFTLFAVAVLLLIQPVRAYSGGPVFEYDISSQGVTTGSSKANLSSEGMLSHPFRQGEVLVKMNTGISGDSLNRLAASTQSRIDRHFSTLSTRRKQAYFLVKSDTISTEALLRQYADHPGVASVSPNYIHHILATPNDPHYPKLWGFNNTGQTQGTINEDINAPQAWNTTTGSSGIVIADIDTGVDYTHPDLAANMWTNPGETPGNGVDDDGNGYVDDIYGIDSANGDADPMDDNGHGTHTVGTIAAVANNSTGVAGVMWNAKIMALKFLGADGSGDTADSIELIEYMIDMKLNHGVNIVASNNSWGGGGFSQALSDAIGSAGDAGILFVAAAGNSNDNNDIVPHYPSSYREDNIIAVSATDHKAELGRFSCYGLRSVDIGAPGVDILSTTITAEACACADASRFSDDMETASGFWSAASPWAITAEQGYSGTKAWSDSPSGNYAANADVSLTSGPLNLSGVAGNLSLSFMIWRELENGFDYLYLEISPDNGSSWTTVYSTAANSPGWSPKCVNIPPAYKTSQFRFRFRLDADDTVQLNGVYIDDVKIGTSMGNYVSWNGTSMAAPHVTGAAGILASRFPSADPLSWKAKLMNSGNPLASLDGK
ncbi:MAG: hypothetical protein D3926_11395, partial [Desulfobacteraceae bacterium]